MARKGTVEMVDHSEHSSTVFPFAVTLCNKSKITFLFVFLKIYTVLLMNMFTPNNSY